MSLKKKSNKLVHIGVILGLALLFLPAAILYLLYYGYKLAFYYEDPKASPYEYGDDEQSRAVKSVLDAAIAEFEKAEYETVSITSHDGLKLTGRYYHVKDGAPVQIQFHGYKGTAFRDFCGGNKLARDLGQNTLLIDERCHGRSEGKTICFGIKEKYDCLAWARYAAERFGDVPIVLSGVSMGGATVLMASELDLPKNVRCIIADCPYSSPEEIIGSESKKIGIPAALGMPFIKMGAFIYGKLKLSGGATEAVKNAKVPIMIIHGEDDRFVPCEMSRKIHAANPKMIRLETFPDAGHGMSYMNDAKRYEKITEEFFKECGL